MHLTSGVEALASGFMPDKHNDMMVCLVALQSYMGDEECSDFSCIDQVRDYARSMVSVALDTEVIRTELMDEIISRVCLSFETKYYPALIRAILLSKIPMCVCGKVMLPKVQQWARILIR